MGFHQAVYAIGMFAGPWLSGILGDVVGIRPTFVVTGLVALGLGLLGTRLLNNGLESAPGTAPAAVDSSSSIR
jgi:MFS family permease